MPFICLRYADQSPDRWAGSGAGIDPGSLEPGWRRLPVAFPLELWARDPCVAWQGMVDGRRCWLLCDGFIARPGRIDVVAASHAPAWLAEALGRTGFDALNDLQGQYALCFVDGGTGEVIAARDRLGGQALYWNQAEGVAAMASKSRDLARLPWCGAAENPAFLADCFVTAGNHVPGTTPFARVSEVVPGGRVRFSADQVHIDRRKLVSDRPDCRTPDEWVESFWSVFNNAVRDVTGDDGDAAVMLSGGLDSGPVLSAASESLRGQGRKLSAISWVLPKFPDSDESDWIRMASGAAGVELETLNGGNFLPFSNVNETALSPELPSFNSVRSLLLACYQRAAARRCAMVLAATNGDMIYARRFAILYDLIGRKDWTRLWSELGCMYRRFGLAGMYRDPALRYPAAILRRRLFGDRQPARSEWLTDYAFEQASGRINWPPEAAQYPNPDHAYQLLGPAMTFGTAQENDFCQRYGIERRDPYHSEALVGLMLHAPVVLSHLKGQSKWIMREAVRGRLPEQLRVKQRTGDLTSFVKAGYDTYRRNIKNFLLEVDESGWPRYVKPDYVRETLDAPDPGDTGIMVICQCIGYTLWREYWNSNG